MTTSIEIQCINKDDRKSRHERIQNVGGVHNGKRWKITEDEAIAYIRNGEYKFFTRAPGNVIADVIIVKHATRPYLRTDPDQTTADNLLSLDSCPI